MSSPQTTINWNKDMTQLPNVAWNNSKSPKSKCSGSYQYVLYGDYITLYANNSSSGQGWISVQNNQSLTPKSFRNAYQYRPYIIVEENVNTTAVAIFQILPYINKVCSPTNSSPSCASITPTPVKYGDMVMISWNFLCSGTGLYQCAIPYCWDEGVDSKAIKYGRWAYKQGGDHIGITQFYNKSSNDADADVGSNPCFVYDMMTPPSPNNLNMTNFLWSKPFNTVFTVEGGSGFMSYYDSQIVLRQVEQMDPTQYLSYGKVSNNAGSIMMSSNTSNRIQFTVLPALSPTPTLACLSNDCSGTAPTCPNSVPICKSKKWTCLSQVTGGCGFCNNSSCNAQGYCKDSPNRLPTPIVGPNGECNWSCKKGTNIFLIIIPILFILIILFIFFVV